jgi:hypothetical protein
LSHPLFELLERLDKAKLYYILSRNRDDAISVRVSFVGERVEVDVFKDGHMEVTRFLGTEDVSGGEEVIDKLIEKSMFEDKAYEKKYSNKRKTR